jgi:hypothetical protein
MKAMKAMEAMQGRGLLKKGKDRPQGKCVGGPNTNRLFPASPTRVQSAQKTQDTSK